MSSKIEWIKNPDGTQGETWNPTLGCSKVSPGCDHCYAIGVAHRAMQPAHRGLTVRTQHGTDWTGEVRCLPDRLDIPLKRRKPTTWFVDSMSDLFHRDVPSDFVCQVWEVMGQTPQHTYQVLTKRPQRMRDLLSLNVPEPWPNVWCGTSIENDRYAWRADHLRDTPATVHWLSLEPLLGPLPSLDLTGIDWVVVGGESGPGARPMHPDWVRDIRDRCVAAGVPFFFKQWGEYEPDPESGRVWADDGRRRIRFITPDAKVTPGPAFGNDSIAMRRVGKKAAGRELDGRTWDEMPDLGVSDSENTQ